MKTERIIFALIFITVLVFLASCTRPSGEFETTYEILIIRLFLLQFRQQLLISRQEKLSPRASFLESHQKAQQLLRKHTIPAMRL